MTVTALFIHRDLPFHGGVPQSFLTFAANRDRARIDMHVASFRKPSEDLVQKFADVGVRVHQLNDNYLTSVRKLRHIVRTGGIDVIVCGSFRSIVVAKLATPSLPCRTVFWIPATNIIQGRLRRTVFQLLTRRTFFIYISQAVADKHHYSRHSGGYTILYHGISSASEGQGKPVSDIREALGLDPRAIVLGFVGEFIPLKNHQTLLQAFDRLANEDTTVHLILIGTGSTLDANRRFAETLDSANRIHFLGARNDVRQLYRQMDIYVHPADGEGFGLAVAEAMLAGLPVVAANAGALPEFVLDEVTGLLFAPHDPAELCAQLCRLTRDPVLRLHLGSCGHRYCLERFGPDRFASEMTALIERETAKLAERRWSW
jgi:glycosyltransferase involved in cell wall biosynthesis